MSTRDRTLGDYFRLMNANGAARVYHEAIERGILDAIGAGAQYSNVFAHDLFRTVEGELLVSSARSAVGDLHSDFATRYQAYAGDVLAQCPQTL